VNSAFLTATFRFIFVLHCTQAHVVKTFMMLNTAPRKPCAATIFQPRLCASVQSIYKTFATLQAAVFFNYLTQPIEVNAFLEALDVTLIFSKAEAVPAANREPVCD
jgi:hypothetical protein